MNNELTMEVTIQTLLELLEAKKYSRARDEILKNTSYHSLSASKPVSPLFYSSICILSQYNIFETLQHFNIAGNIFRRRHIYVIAHIASFIRIPY
jgi:hypothetical protein